MLRPRQFWLWSNLNKPAVSIIGSEVFIFRDATTLSLPQEQHIGFNICRITLAVNKTKSYEEAVETSHILTHSSSSKFRCPLFVQYERASTEAAQTASGASTQIADTPNYSVSSSSTNPSSPTDPSPENSSTTISQPHLLRLLRKTNLTYRKVQPRLPATWYQHRSFRNMVLEPIMLVC